MTDNLLPVWIGWDSREPEAAEVCKSTLIKHASIPIHVRTLKEIPLQHAGLYKRRWVHNGTQKVDTVDGKPFSTDFSFTRFLIPSLQLWDGWAIFCDCDFLFNADIGRMVDELDDAKAVMVCKQGYQPVQAIKMDGVKQEKYYRKNWSSFMAFNCGHPTNRHLTPEVVSNQTGSYLHGFGWVPDNEIGNLDHRWNWIHGTTEGAPFAVHYTLGGPWFPHLRDSELPYFDAWRAEAKRIGIWT